MLDPFESNVETTADNLCLTRWISHRYTGLLDDDGDCTRPVENV
jgi:hypothetical protein